MLRMIEWSRLRLVGLVVCLLVVGFGVTNVISYYNAVSVLKSTILHNELPLTGSNIYSEVQADLIRPVFISSVMANDTFLKDWLLAGEQDPDRAARYLDAIRDKYGVFTSFLISDATKRYYRFNGGERYVRTNNPEDVWYFRARAMTAPYEINIDYDISANRTVAIFVNYRIVGPDGRFLGITGVGLNIESVQRIVKRYRNDFQRNVYFTTRGGEVTVTSEGGPKQGSRITALPGINLIAGRILSAPEGQYEYDRDGETYLLDTRLIPELGWYVVVEQRQADATKGLWRSFLTNLWIGFAVILSTVVVIAWTLAVYHRRLIALATTDKLTGVANRYAFDQAMAGLEQAGRRSTRPLSLMLLDIDNFKQINDIRGHLRGDEVIRAIAACTVASLPKGDVVYRWGGDELIVVAKDCDLEKAAKLADTVRECAELTPVLMPDDGTRVTVSAGITVWRDGDTVDQVLARVDRALHQAKQDGRNRVRIAAPIGQPVEALV